MIKVLCTGNNKFNGHLNHGRVWVCLLFVYKSIVKLGGNMVSQTHNFCLSSHSNFNFCDLHILKLSIFISSSFTPLIFPILHFFKLKNPNLHSSKKTGTSPESRQWIVFKISKDWCCCVAYLNYLYLHFCTIQFIKIQNFLPVITEY